MGGVEAGRQRVEETKRRLELALKPAESPTVEEVLRHVERHGVLRGPVDWVFDAWRLYVEYAKERIAERFNSTQDEAAQLEDFTHKLSALLGLAREQAREKLESVQRAVREGTYRMEGRRLYAPDGTWIGLGERASYVPVHGLSDHATFPNFSLLHEKLELLQLGWRASDEGVNNIRPRVTTTQPWQIFAWAATRPGKMWIYISQINLVSTGVTVLVELVSLSWRERWSKEEAIRSALSYVKSGELTPLVTWFLGDGVAELEIVIGQRYVLQIGMKDDLIERYGLERRKRNCATIARGRDVFRQLMDVAGAYGALLDVLRVRKWNLIKAVVSGELNNLYLQTHGTDVCQRPSSGRTDRCEATDLNCIEVEGVPMRLQLSGTLYAEYYTRKREKAVEIKGRLEVFRLAPKIRRSGAKYIIYLTLDELLQLMQKDARVRGKVTKYLQEKIKNGSLKQRETAEKLMRRYPTFLTPPPLISTECDSENGSQNIPHSRRPSSFSKS